MMLQAALRRVYRAGTSLAGETES